MSRKVDLLMENMGGLNNKLGGIMEGMFIPNIYIRKI